MRYLAGIDNLSSIDHVLRGKKIGLLTNPSGVNSNLCSTIDILNEKYTLVKLFAPEHGIRGEIQAGVHVPSYTDEQTGLEVVSMFGENYADAIKSVDCIVYDIQGIGVRHFSYPYLMADVMKSAAVAGIPFVVLDRYNPLGLNKISGNIFDDTLSCAFGGFSLATRHGMTIGELAKYINAEYQIGCELYVAPCVGLERDKDYTDYKPHWILPGPNCPTYETALCYVGSVLFEGTNVSEGRGTTKPFELIGAPWLRNQEVVERMRSMHLDGVAFRTAYFCPTFSKYSGEHCRALQIHVTDKDTFDPYLCALLLFDTIRKTHSEFQFVDIGGMPNFFDHLTGTSRLRDEDFAPIAYIESQKGLLEKFKEISKKYYIY